MNILSKIVAIKKQEITQKKKVRCLDEIKSSENLNRKTHSLSQKIKEGENIGTLAGVPITIKVNTETKDRERTSN